MAHGLHAAKESYECGSIQNLKKIHEHYKTFVFFGNFIVQFLTMNFIDDNFMLQCQKVGHTCDVRVGSYSSTGVNHMQIITLEFHSKYLCGHRQCTYCYYFPQ